jgi:hypothetical protein
VERANVWRGAALARSPASLALFVSTLVQPERVKTGGSRERPSGLQLQPSGSFNESEAIRLNAARWIIPGSRLLPKLCGPNRALNQYR